MMTTIGNAWWTREHVWFDGQSPEKWKTRGIFFPMNKTLIPVSLNSTWDLAGFQLWLQINFYVLVVFVREIANS